MLTIRSSGLLFLALALTLAACGSSGGGSSSDGSVTGVGGRSGIGGASGTAGASGTGGASSGGTGGSSGAACGDLPSCIADLYAGCTPSGTCIESMTTTTPVQTNICYANGVKALSTTTIDVATLSATFALTVKNAAGTVCFTASGPATTTMTMLTYKNAAGTTVGTETSTTGGATTVTCGGQTTTVTNQGSCPMPSATSGSSCTKGTCS